MKVILVTHSMYPESIGGREKYVYYLAEGLGKKGHNVSVFTCTPTIRSKVRKYDSFTVYYFPSLDIPLKSAKYRIPVGMVWKLLTNDADVVHAHDLHHFTTFASALASKINGKPLVVTEHGYPESEGMMKMLIKFYDRTLLRFIGKSSSKIIGVSNFISEELRDRYGIKDSKIVTVHNAVNMENYKELGNGFLEKYSLTGKMIILGIGRMTKEKGFQYLIKAFKKVNGRFTNTVLALIGPWTEYKNSLDGLVRDLGLEGNVIFTGPLEDSLVKGAIKSCELVVIPSEYEPMPLVALEALHLRKPIIASNVGGLAEIFEDKISGLLTKPGDENDLEEKIEMLISDSSMKNKLIENSESAIKRFDWYAFLEKIESIYEEVKKN